MCPFTRKNNTCINLQFTSAFLRTTLCFAFIVLFLISGCAPIFVKQDPWFGRDKMYHFVCSGAIGAGATLAVRSNGGSEQTAPVIGVTVAVGIGGGKELYDLTIKKTYWSWKDFIWDIAGSAAGSYAAAR